MFKYNSKKYIFLFSLFQFNIAAFILTGFKTLNKFLYLSRHKIHYKQNKTKSCSFIDGSDCLFTEKKYLSEYSKNNEKIDIIIQNWNNSFLNIEKYGIEKLIYFYENKTKEYLLQNINKIDKKQNSQGEVLTYLLTFDNYDDITKQKDIYFEESDKAIFYNQEIIIEIKGKLKLTYNKDLSEAYLNQIHEDYPSNSYGIIESNFITISFKGKFFIVDFIYIKAHNEQNKKETIYFIGYLGNKVVYNKAYKDDKKRNEKWIKIFFQPSIPINSLIILGPYDIDNISFTFPNKIYEINMNYDKNVANLIKDEDI